MAACQVSLQLAQHSAACSPHNQCPSRASMALVAAPFDGARRPCSTGGALVVTLLPHHRCMQVSSHAPCAAGAGAFRRCTTRTVGLPPKQQPSKGSVTCMQRILTLAPAACLQLGDVPQAHRAACQPAIPASRCRCMHAARRPALSAECCFVAASEPSGLLLGSTTEHGVDVLRLNQWPRAACWLNQGAIRFLLFHACMPPRHRPVGDRAGAAPSAHAHPIMAAPRACGPAGQRTWRGRGCKHASG